MSELLPLIERIHLINRSWKLAQERCSNDVPFSQALRDLKSGVQVQLLRAFPEHVWLSEDRDTPSDEPLLSVRIAEALSGALGGRPDADHIPLRVAEELLTDKEMEIFLK